MDNNKSSEEIMVTIRCLAYNHEPYIRQCLEGFVMQKTNFRFEAIVHDDASTDGTAVIIKEYAEKYPDIIKPIFETENQYSKRDGSITRIMNEHTHGKYIAMCEGDDYWIDPLKLQKQVDFLEANPEISYVFTNRYIYNEKTGVKYVQKHKIKKYTTYDILSGFNPGIQNVCYRKDCIENINWDKYVGINGDRLMPYLSSMMGKIGNLSDITSVYRITGKGVSTCIPGIEWYKHASIDFYNFHKILKFPNWRSYCKGQANYQGVGIKQLGLYGSYKELKKINPRITCIQYLIILWYLGYKKMQHLLGMSVTKQKINIEYLSFASK